MVPHDELPTRRGATGWDTVPVVGDDARPRCTWWPSGLRVPSGMPACSQALAIRAAHPCSWPTEAIIPR